MKKSKELEDIILKGTQYIIAPSVNDFPLDFDPWANFPKWDVDTACKAITLSRMIDIEESRRIAALEFQTKPGECPIIARHICTVYDRAKLLADNAIKVGIINDLDTPANWIKWAEDNRYSVQHLKFIIDPETLKTFQKSIDEYEDIDLPIYPSHKNVNVEKNRGIRFDDWKISAKEIAKSIFQKNPKLSVAQISIKTHDVMLGKKDAGEHGMTGRSGRVPSPETIKRHALTGIKS